MNVTVYYEHVIFRPYEWTNMNFPPIPNFSFYLRLPLFGSPTSLLLSPCLSSNSLTGVLREEADVSGPDCIQNSSKRHEEKSLNQGDWLLFPLSSSWTTIDDCLRGLGPDSVWLADCSSGPVWGPVNVALWEVPLCALPSDKSSFPRERGAELECKSKGRVGPQEVEGTQFPSREPQWESLGVCLYGCATYVYRKHAETSVLS